MHRISTAPCQIGYSRYCWRIYFKVLEVLFLGEVFPAFLPSKKACGIYQFRHLGVRQQYPVALAITISSAMLATSSLYGARDMCARDEDTMGVRLRLSAYPQTSRLPMHSTLAWERVSVHHHAWALVQCDGNVFAF